MKSSISALLSLHASVACVNESYLILCDPMDCRLAWAFPRGLPDRGFKTGSADDLPSEPPGKPLICVSHKKTVENS